MKTQRKIIFLVSALALLMVCGLFYLRQTESSRVSMLLINEQEKNTALLGKIIHSKSSALKTYSTDYTYWDEMVQFVKKPDSVWANANIRVSMPSYEVDYVWIFNEKFEPRYDISGMNVPVIDDVVISKEMLRKLTAGSRLFHFFIKTGAGIVEISGATIHPTSDPDRLSEPMGYFAAGRLWSESLLGAISGLTASDIKLCEINNNDTAYAGTNIDDFLINSVYVLDTWENKPLVLLLSSREVMIVKSMNKQSNNQFAAILVFVVCFLLLLSISLYYMVNLPLNKTARSLRENNTSHIKKLRVNRDEFGEMARLIYEFFIQKQKLIKEIEERTEAEERLLISEEDLKHSLNEKEVLIKEIHHRVKNNLQIIISLIRLQNGKIDDQVTVGHLNTTLNRIKSISLVHELLYRSGDLSRIDLNTYISQFTASLKEIYLSSSRRISIEVSVNDIFLGVEKAIPCGIIINELVTNSFKHAFTGLNCGIIKISMEKSGSLITLKVSDNGIGIRSDFNIEESSSLGLFLLKSLSTQIDAEFEIESNNGTTIILRFDDGQISSIKPKKEIKAAIPIIFRNGAVFVK